MASTINEWGNGDVLLSTTIDNGDGTGTTTTFDADGNVTSVEQLTGLPIPEPPEPTAEERLATLLAALTDAQSLEEIRDAAAAAGAGGGGGSPSAYPQGWVVV